MVKYSPEKVAMASDKETPDSWLRRFCKKDAACCWIADWSSNQTPPSSWIWPIYCLARCWTSEITVLRSPSFSHLSWDFCFQKVSPQQGIETNVPQPLSTNKSASAFEDSYKDSLMDTCSQWPLRTSGPSVYVPFWIRSLLKFGVHALSLCCHH